MGRTHGYANQFAIRALAAADAPAAGSADLVAAQHQGAKVVVRPVYEAPTVVVAAFGLNVELASKKARVSLLPIEAVRFDPAGGGADRPGARPQGASPAGRPEESGSFNSMVTHRVKLASAKEVDRELIGWLRSAYAEA